MRSNDQLTYTTLITVVLAILSFSSFAFLSINKSFLGVYSSIVYLPLLYLLGIVFSKHAMAVLPKSPVTILLIGGFFFRLVVTPALFCAGGCTSFFNANISEANVVKATVLLSLEMLSVFIAMGVFTSRSDVYNCRTTAIELNKYNSKGVAVIIILLLLFLVFAYNFVPELQTIYIPIHMISFSDVSSIMWDNETLVPRGGLTRYVYSLFMFVWPIVRAALPALCISQIFKAYGKSNGSLFLSLLCAIIPSALLSGDNIAPFLGAFLAMLVILRLYGAKAYSVLVFVAAILLVIAGVVISSKLEAFEAWRGASGIASIAQLVQAYFPGFDSIAVGFNIVDHNKLNTAIFDLYYGIPFKETLLGWDGEYLGDLFTEAAGLGGQIVPWAYQLSHYFSIIGGPIITYLFIWCAYSAEKRARKTSNFWRYYINLYGSVLIAISISAYSFSIFLRSVVCVLIPMLLIVYFGNRALKTRSLSIDS